MFKCPHLKINNLHGDKDTIKHCVSYVEMFMKIKVHLCMNKIHLSGIHSYTFTFANTCNFTPIVYLHL